MSLIEEYRTEIDKIDDQMAFLYNRRMALVRKIGAEKVKSNNVIPDIHREKKILDRVMKEVNPDIQEFTKLFFTAVFDTGKAYQNICLRGNNQ